MHHPHIYASCPHEGLILDYYKSYFKSVYVLLHPFARPTTLDMKPFYGDNPGPTKNEILDGCEPVHWKDILEVTALKSISEIDVGLRTYISSLNERHTNQVFAKALMDLKNTHNIHMLSEGTLSPFLENRLLSAIKNQGHDWLWIGDEFCTERKLHRIDDLIEQGHIHYAANVFTHDQSILVTTHWDSQCSFLCSSKRVIQNILEFEPFEGFYCSEKTEVYWGLYEI